jgi:hypothetical protein
VISKTEQTIQRVAALVVCTAVLVATPHRAAATDVGAEPCTEYEECMAFAQLQDDCAQDNGSHPEHQFCAWYIAGCYVDEGHVHWFGQCYDNGSEACPELLPCAG